MKMELTAEEVRGMVAGQASKLVLPGRVGDVETVTMHTAGSATVEFAARTVEPPTVEEAKEAARTRAKPPDTGGTETKDEKGKK